MPRMKLIASCCAIADCDYDRKRTDFYDTAITGFDGCPWLLPNPDTRSPYTGIKRAWTRHERPLGFLT